MYHVDSAFTASALIASKCDCKAGSDDDDISSLLKHICVHDLPTKYKLSVLLIDGLAEHFLVELASCFHASDERSLTSCELNKMAEAVHTLMDASDCTDSPVNLRKPTELLQHFKVSTEKRGGTRTIPEPPDPAELGPIRNYKRTSPEETAKLRLKLKTEDHQEANANNVSSIDDNNTFDPDYVSTWRLCCALNRKVSSSESTSTVEELIGHRLLEARAKEKGMSNTAIDLIDEGLRQNIGSCLFGEAESRRGKRASGKKRKSLSNEEDEPHSNEADRPQSSCSADESREPIPHDDSSLPKKTITYYYKRTSVEARKTCAMRNCQQNLDGVATRSVPPPPKTPEPDQNGIVSKNRAETYGRKCFRRAEYLRRLGIPRGDQRKDIRFCCNHNLVKVRKRFSYEYQDPKTGETILKTTTEEFEVPDDMGPNSNRPGASVKSPSKGTASDRQKLLLLKEAKNKSVDIALQQQAELSDGGRTALLNGQINPRVLREAGLDVHIPSGSMAGLGISM